ncbi:hypothetical protein FOA24_02455 [Bacillus thuringiensis]|uniref:insecticidal delta-endotoxin Cry8Ea1 family protein n=1 Tax=Bacillus thuringiensis TaxID=1428 RepID=UPI0033350C85
MNRNGNNNEFTNNNGMVAQPRHPLMNAPRSELQNMNTFGAPMARSASTTNTANTIRDGAILGTGILWAILSIPFPAASAVAGLFNVLLPYWWPVEDATPGTPQAQFTWEQLMSAVEDLIDERILESKRSDALARWQGIQTLGRDYTQVISDLKADPGNITKQERVRDAFDDVEDYLKVSMPYFRAQNFEIPMLAMYAQAANMHLLLLRDVVQHGASWGFQQYEIDRYHSNTGSLGNPGLLQLSSIYTEHCTTWYNTGLTRLRNTDDWNKFNDFRRNMTIMAMDIVSLWPTYDPKLYAVPTKSQLTRTVYTRRVGPTRDATSSPQPIGVVEDNVVKNPGLFARLREMEIDKTNETFYITRFKQTFQNTLDAMRWTTVKGTSYPDVTTKTLTIPSSQPEDDVWRITHSVNKGLPFDDDPVTGWRFSFTQSSDQTCFLNSYEGGPIEYRNFGLPCRDRSFNFDLGDSCNDKTLYSHRFSYLGAGVWRSYRDNHPNLSFPGLTYYSYGWTHISADHNNLIDADKITQIPAVKGYQLSNTAEVIKGPGHTGGDLVKLSSGTERGFMSIWITLPSAQQRYRVRIRYASNMQTTLNISMVGASGTFTAPTTTGLTDLTKPAYNQFKYLDTVVLSQSGGTNHINMYTDGSGSGSFILDKIEFIPM